MLPFLKKKHIGAAGLIVQHRQKDDKQNLDDSSISSLDCAKDLLNAIERKDVQGIADALDAHKMLPEDSEAEPHSYDAQNEKAGEQE